MTADVRAADWRYFLARRTWRRVLLGPGVPDSLVEAIEQLAHGVDRYPSTERDAGLEPRVTTPAELVLLSDPAPHVLDVLARRGEIGPATVLVIFGTPSHLSTRPAEAACEERSIPGEAEVLTLRVVPGAAGPTVYYPVDNAAARRYVWRFLLPPTSLKGRLARLGLERAGGAVVTRIRETTLTIVSPRGSMVHQARDLVVISSGRVQSNPVIAVEVPHDRPRSEPTRVFKIPRDPTFSAMIEREQSRLAWLQRVLPGAPIHPLGPVQWGDQGQGWAQSAFEGIPFGTRRRSERLGDLQYLALWLCELERATALQISTGAMKPPEVNAWSRSLVRSVQSAFSLNAAERAYLQDLPTRLRKAGIRLTLAHRDAGPWNILSSRRQAVLIDWESAGWGLPGEDLLYLLLYVFASWTDPSSRETTVSAFRSRFVDPSRRPDWLDDVLFGLRRHLAVDSRGFQDVFAATLLTHALRLHHLARSSRGKVPLSQPLFEFWREVVAQGEEPWEFGDRDGHGVRA